LLRKKATSTRHCCTKTVQKALRRKEPPTQPGHSILDPYGPRIDALIGKYPELSAVRVLEEISKGDDGYSGGVSLVRRYLRQIRPVRGRIYQEVFYEPGEAMQVDWGECGRVMIGNTSRRVSVLVAIRQLEPRNSAFTIASLNQRNSIVDLRKSIRSQAFSSSGISS
jgi:hypothetical protein